MPFMLFAWKYKIWIVIAIFLILYIGQIAYTNHLAAQLNKAEAKCNTEKAKIHAEYKEQAEKDAKDYQEALAEKQTAINKLSSDYETKISEHKVKVETVTKYVNKIVERDVYRNVCIDDDGMQQLNSLIKSRSAS